MPHSHGVQGLGTWVVSMQPRARRPQMRRTSHLFLAAAIAACAAVGPQAASAATVETISSPEFPDNIDYVAAPGEANHLSVSVQGNDVVFQDTGAPITVGAGCAQDGPNAAKC